MMSNMARSYKDFQGGSKIGMFKIRLNEDKVIFKHPYRRSEKEQQVLKKITDELLELGRIRLSESEHSSPFFGKLKGDGTVRPMLDFRLLNSITQKED